MIKWLHFYFRWNKVLAFNKCLYQWQWSRAGVYVTRWLIQSYSLSKLSHKHVKCLKSEFDINRHFSYILIISTLQNILYCYLVTLNVSLFKLPLFRSINVNVNKLLLPLVTSSKPNERSLVTSSKQQKQNIEK